MSTRRTIAELFGTTFSVIQAPMAGSAGVRMATAVCEAGGLGSIAGTLMSPTELAVGLKRFAEDCGKPLNVNFFAHKPPTKDEARNQAWLRRVAPYFETLGIPVPGELTQGSISPFDVERCAVLEQHRPAVVSFHFGLPEAALVRRLRDAGIKVLSSATTVAEAVWLQANGCDAVIAQGIEAGGHRGMFLSEGRDTQVGTLALVPQIVDATVVPVIAAGGIADARGAAAAVALGASGVQAGTAYLHTEESDISPVYRETLRTTAAHETCLSNVFSGRLTRVRLNEFARELGPLSADAPAFPLGFAVSGPLRRAAEDQGVAEFSPHYCGQAAALGRPKSAAELTRELGVAFERATPFSRGA